MGPSRGRFRHFLRFILALGLLDGESTGQASARGNIPDPSVLGLPLSAGCYSGPMPKDTADPVAVCRQLDQINRRIAKHPLNSEKFTRARALMREAPAEERGTVSAALREQDLPSVPTQMRMMLFGLTSLARLNRRRIKLEEQLADAEGRG
ncbi:hypothetical protein AO716_15715 [Arthrobacter sp. Edens01]|nr:hypothetical protein AO716_15715 [Arthrobacter sp. Edens01]